MKTFIFTLLFFILVLYVARLSVTFKPFKVTFETPYIALGSIFLFLALSFYSYQFYLNGKKAAHKEITVIVNKILKEEQLLKEQHEANETDK